MLDVGSGGLRYPKAVEGEQGDQGVLGGRAEPGGDQKGPDFVAVQGGGVRLVVQPGTPDVRGWRVVEEFLLNCVLVEPGDRRQAAGDGGAGPAAGFEFAREGLDVGAADREQRQGPSPAPAGELPQVEGVGLAGQAAVPGEVTGERESLRISERRWMGRGKSSQSRQPSWHLQGGRAVADPSDERCPQRTPPAQGCLHHNRPSLAVPTASTARSIPPIRRRGSGARFAADPRPELPVRCVPPRPAPRLAQLHLP